MAPTATRILIHDMTNTHKMGELNIWGKLLLLILLPLFLVQCGLVLMLIYYALGLDTLIRKVLHLFGKHTDDDYL